MGLSKEPLADKRPEITPIEEGYRADRPLRTLWYLLQEDRPALIGVLVLFLIKHSPTWVIPVTTANIINAITADIPHPYRTIFINMAIMLVLVVQNFGTNYWFSKKFSHIARAMEARLRSGLVRRMQQLSIGFHEGFHTGWLHAKVLRDVESIEMLAKQMVQVFFSAFIGIVITLSITLMREPWVALFYLITIPAIALLRHHFRDRMRQTSADFRHEIESMSSRVSEMIEMIPVTRAHNAEDFEIRRMDHQLVNVKEKGQNVDILRAIFSAASWVIFQSSRILCLVFTAILALRGMIKVGDVVMFNSFFMMMVRDVSSMLNIYPIMARGFEAIRSIGEVLESPDLERNQGKRHVRKVDGAFQFESVSFNYYGDGKAAIDRLDFTVETGESIAVVGESGSGKTTLMNLIIGFHRPVSGRILLDGRDMAELDLRQYRSFLSVVSQNTILFSGSVKENVAYGMHGLSDEKTWEALAMANADLFVKELPRGLATTIGEHGAKLSGGQRQRIAIARALIRDPRVIIFDEATSSLDVASEHIVQQAIDKLVYGRTTFIVAHRLSTIRNAGRILVMHKGRCLEAGGYEELLQKRGEFYRLHSLQKWHVNEEKKRRLG